MFFRLVSIGLVALLGATAPSHASTTGGADPVLMDALRYVLRQTSGVRYSAVLDYRQHSRVPRFHIVDRLTGDIVESFVASHGGGSDRDQDGYADRFSDVPHSNASSIGLFRVGERYRSGIPHYGTALRLIGLSSTNGHAADRNIVLHGATYMEPDWIESYGRPGVSEGCIALAAADRDRVLRYLARDALIYAMAEPRPATRTGSDR